MLTKINLLLCAIMGLCAALQYNDPDPLPWIAFYTLAATAGFLYTARVGPQACIAVAAVGGRWAVHIARAHHEIVSFTEIAQSMQAQAPGIELSRELGGLSLSSAWLAALGIGEWMRRREKQRALERNRDQTKGR